jgi:hypothetical protein
MADEGRRERRQQPGWQGFRRDDHILPVLRSIEALLRESVDTGLAIKEGLATIIAALPQPPARLRRISLLFTGSK